MTPQLKALGLTAEATAEQINNALNALGLDANATAEQITAALKSKKTAEPTPNVEKNDPKAVKTAAAVAGIFKTNPTWGEVFETADGYFFHKKSDAEKYAVERKLENKIPFCHKKK